MSKITGGGRGLGGVGGGARIHPSQGIRSRMGPFLLLALLGAVVGLMLYLERSAEEARQVTAAALLAQPGGGAAPGAGAEVVEIAGAVERPGVYRLEPGQRLGELLALATPRISGPTPPSWAGLSLSPGQRVEVLETPAGAGLAFGEMSAEARLLFGLPLDLNRAEAEELALLPGIGPKTAEAIVAHRAAHGDFDRVEALTEVKGVGPRTLEAVAPNLRVSRPAGEGASP